MQIYGFMIQYDQLSVKYPWIQLKHLCIWLNDRICITFGFQLLNLRRQNLQLFQGMKTSLNPMMRRCCCCYSRRFLLKKQLEQANYIIYRCKRIIYVKLRWQWKLDETMISFWSLQSTIYEIQGSHAYIVYHHLRSKLSSTSSAAADSKTLHCMAPMKAKPSTAVVHRGHRCKKVQPKNSLFGWKLSHLLVQMSTRSCCF